MNTDKKTIERLRRDLPTLRSIAGWSAEYLATLLDVSRVTVVNIENTENKMSTIQYLAIRALLQEEIRINKNQTLKDALVVLVDREDVSEKIRQELRDRAAQAAKKVGRKAGQTAISNEVNKTLSEMRLSDISEEVVLRGNAKIAEVLTRPMPTKRRKNHE